ncbi:PREDICTED: THAP domain-containing protein 6-like [Amphimedon queenslandica]|uniref:THAP-type domain-containing protein n=1 Tax=Amphimedon queenslandica TaxID=400682 RepID=A0AAN0IKF7_AMPQE|nr:PREDICTED: THAP domain-containing protein 6-like [Amphimedon queenslandica]|eukprot:XP_011403049.1 PREDICTED: THAP domain-containing protein 6-like [Amphimedon queenslandica]
MVRRCIVGGCSNTTRDGISLHKFPSNILTRKQWIPEVKKTRANWKKPSAFSEVCSDHFSEDCFESIADKLGLRMKRILKPNAIPTIFKSRPYNKTKSRISTALQKRERARTILILSNRPAKLILIIVIAVQSAYHDEESSIEVDSGSENLEPDSTLKVDVSIQAEPIRKRNLKCQVRELKKKCENTCKRIENGVQCNLLEPSQSGTILEEMFLKTWNMKQMVKVMHLLVYLKLISPLKMMAICEYRY